MALHKKTYLDLKKESILFIILFGFINFIKKCYLDNNLVNFMISHVEFSSIYLPKVEVKGQLLLTKKLFSLKSQKTLFNEEKSKFIEKKKSKKIFQHMTLNFITKELYKDNIDITINDLKNDNHEIPNIKNNKRYKMHYSCKFANKKMSLFRNNSCLQNLEKQQFRRSHLIYLDLNSIQKPLSLLQQKKFFKINNYKNNLKQSILDNLLYYQLEGKGDQLANDNKKIIQKIVTMIHQNKLRKKVNNSNIDYYELLRRIKGKENIEIILRTLIKEGEISLFLEYFQKHVKFIDINCTDEDGNSLLILSVKVGINTIAKILLEAGIDVDIQNKEGNSALHYALSGKNYIIADILKKYGAKEDCYNKYGLTPWDCVSIDANFMEK